MDSLLSRMINQKFELKEIKSEIEKLDFVALCKIYKKDSETLKLEIVEKEPLAVVRNVSGQCFLVTIDFDLISSANLKQTSYPIIEWGEEEVSNFVEKNLVLLMILKRVKKEYPEIYKSISEVVGNGDEICLVTKSTRTKILTTTKDLLQDLEIISALLKRNDMGKFLKNTIDLRFDNIMVVR
ncbi:MAG: cell division protein FtsQ/DivIB [Candidatus Kapaibacteriota bacterium]